MIGMDWLLFLGVIWLITWLCCRGVPDDVYALSQPPMPRPPEDRDKPS